MCSGIFQRVLRRTHSHRNLFRRWQWLTSVPTGGAVNTAALFQIHLAHRYLFSVKAISNHVYLARVEILTVHSVHSERHATDVRKQKTFPGPSRRPDGSLPLVYSEIQKLDRCVFFKRITHSAVVWWVLFYVVGTFRKSSVELLDKHVPTTNGGAINTMRCFVHGFCLRRITRCRGFMSSLFRNPSAELWRAPMLRSAFCGGEASPVLS